MLSPPPGPWGWPGATRAQPSPGGAHGVLSSAVAAGCGQLRPGARPSLQPLRKARPAPGLELPVPVAPVAQLPPHPGSSPWRRELRGRGCSTSRCCCSETPEPPWRLGRFSLPGGRMEDGAPVLLLCERSCSPQGSLGGFPGAQGPREGGHGAEGTPEHVCAGLQCQAGSLSRGIVRLSLRLLRQGLQRQHSSCSVSR